MKKRKKKRTREKTLGHQLRIARKCQKLTVEQLAQEINMRVRYIDDIEKNVITNVPMDVLYKLARACDTTISFLLNLPATVKKQ